MKCILFLILFINSFNFAQIENNVVNPISEEKLDQIINNRNGKILLINIWATWCIPCREEFPDLVKLANIFEEKLDILAISVDYEVEISTKVLPFLKQNNVHFPVYLSDFENDEMLIQYFSDKWNGALPGSFIYDMNGKQIKFLEGKQSYECFSSIIENI